MITGMQRLTAAINGQRSDRVPIFCNLLDQGARELGMSPADYYSRGECVAEGQLRMRERFGYDNVWCLFFVGKDAELFGCKDIVFAGDGPPNVGSFVIQSHEDIRRLRVPDSISDNPVFQEEAKCLRILRDEVGGQYPVCAYVTAPMALPALLMGMEQWLQLLLFGPSQERDLLLEKCHDFFVKRVAAYRDGGADVILYSNPFGSTDIVPRHLFDSYSLPWIQRDIRSIGPDGVVYYCGMARLRDAIRPVLSSTAIPAYYLSPLDDIAACCSEISDSALTCGVINDIRLIDWTAEEIRGEVKRIIDVGRKHGKFLFGTGVMPYCIPESSIRVMLDAAYEFGGIDRLQ